MRAADASSLRATTALHPPDDSTTFAAIAYLARQLDARQKVAISAPPTCARAAAKAASRLPKLLENRVHPARAARIAAAMIAELHAIFPAVEYEGERCAADHLHATVDPS